MKSRRTPGPILLLALLAGMCSFSDVRAQLLADDFNRADNSVVGNGWTEFETISPTSVSISGNSLLLKSHIAGREQVSQVTPGTYETTLSNNPCPLEWSFNMRQNALNPTGFGPGSTGMAMVLAGSHPNLTQGQGYAVVLGSGGTTINPLRLVRYNNGLSHNNQITDMISVGNFNSHYLAVRVVYDPVTDTWEMFYASSTTGFTDPTAASTSAGTSGDTQYTGMALPYIGCLWNHGSVYTTRARFDNIRVPYPCDSRVEFESSASSVNSFAGSVQIPIAITHPHLSNAAYVDVTLFSGDPALIGGFTSTTLSIPGNTTTGYLELDIPVNGGCIGDQQLIFDISGVSGGSGTIFIGEQSKHYLTIVDDRSGTVQLLDESFETDGSGARYTLNAAHGTNGSGSYFIRGTSAEIGSAGGNTVSSVHGGSLMGMAGLSTLAPNSEVTIDFPAMDILGMSELNIQLMAGGRPAALFDQAFAQRDHLIIEANIDGAGWTTVGAFRSHKENPYVDGWLRQDTDLDGVGDGADLTDVLANFAFAVNTPGSTMELRIRVRTTAAMEDIYLDRVQVLGNRCRPYYFSTNSGLDTDAIWSPTENGTPAAIAIGRHTTLIIQEGHTVAATSMNTQVDEMVVETNAALQLGHSTWELHGSRLTNDGTISATSGGLSLQHEGPVVLDGTGSYDLYDLTANTPGGVTLSNALDIRGSLDVREGVFDATAAAIRLRSTATGTGRLARLTGGADLLGDLTMERYIPAGATNWRFLGSPVQGATIQDWQDDFFTAGYPGSHYPNFYSGGVLWPSIRWYDETNTGPGLNDGLLGVTSSQALARGQGFAAWCGTNLNTTNAFTIDMHGTPNIAHSPITLPMTYTDTGVPSTDGYNLVSNPLPSPIAFSEIQRGADVGEFYWIFDPATGSNATWNGVVGTNGANGIIQSSQAFWLKATGPDVTTTVDETAKVSGNTGGIFGDQLNDLPMVRLRVSDQALEFTDEALVVFALGTPANDALDAPKLEFFRLGAPLISTLDLEENNLAINMYGMPTTSISIPVDVRVTVTGTHVIHATDLEEIAGLSCLRLEDLQENVIVPLNSGDSYTFEMDENYDGDPRFVLHLSAPLTRETIDVSCHGAANGSVTVTTPDGPAAMSLLNVFSAELQEAAGEVVTFEGLDAGHYMVSVASDAGCGDLIGAFTISEPMPLEAEFATTPASCGMDDGVIMAEVYGGVEPYEMAWSDGTIGGTLTAGEGSYTLAVTDANGCDLTSDAQILENTALPMAMFQIMQEDVMPGEVVEFINLGNNAEVYTWDMGDGIVINSPDMAYMYGQPGVYTITLTATLDNCSDTYSMQLIVGDVTAVEEHASAHDLAVWYDGININIGHSIEAEGMLTVELLDATGRTHARASAAGVPGVIGIPAAGLSTGVWFVTITNTTMRMSERIVIMR